MNLLETLLQAQGGDAVRQVAGRFGLDESQASSAISALLPALTGGLQSNVAQQGGLEGLLGALSSGRHDRFLDDPSSLATEDTVAEGNGILGHILGSKDVSRQVASQAADQTGLAPTLMKQMLPVVATMVMAALSKQRASAEAPQQGILWMLSPMLDQNRDGNVADDVLGMVGKLFR
jgi:hypothetical protein